MERTKKRPLVQKRLDEKKVKRWQQGGYILSNIIYLTYFPYTSVIAANLIYSIYIHLYTPFKRISPFNTHLGAIAGAIPPVLGYLAAGGNLINTYSISMFAYMYGW